MAATPPQADFEVSDRTAYVYPAVRSGDLVVTMTGSNAGFHVGYVAPTSNALLSITDTQVRFGSSNSAITLSNALLGVGTTTPSYPVDIVGDLNFTGTLRQGGAPYVGSQWSNIASNVFILNSNIGIGTSNPTAPLEVAGTINSSNITTSNIITRFINLNSNSLIAQMNSLGSGSTFPSNLTFNSSYPVVDSTNGLTLTNTQVSFPAAMGYIFDGNTATSWSIPTRDSNLIVTNGITGFCIDATFNTPKMIESYMINPYVLGSLFAPSQFYMFASSNSGSNWVQIDYRTNVTSWVSGTPSYFSIATSNQNFYRTYRLCITLPLLPETFRYVAIREYRLIETNRSETFVTVDKLSASNTSVTSLTTSNINFTGQLLQNGTPYIGSQFSNISSNVFILGSNIGIGTSNPISPLHVVGNITIASNIVLSQNAIQSIGAQTGRLSNIWVDNISTSSTLVVGASNTTIAGDVTINGNATIMGSNFIANVQTVEVKDNTLLLNKGETGAGVTAGTAGLSIDRGTTSNPYQVLYQESTQTLRIGLSNALETAATREWVTPTSNAAFAASNTAIWSSNNLLNKAGGFMSGPLYQNPADSSNAPSYSFSNDTNTGMFHQSQGALGFAASGSNVMTLCNSMISLNTNLTLPNRLNFGGVTINTRSTAGPTNVSVQPQFNINSCNVFLPTGSNLGIGLSNPRTALEVSGTITASAPGQDSLVLQGGNNFTSFTISNSRGNAQFGLAYTAGNYSTNAGSNDFILRTPGKILLQSGATSAALCVNSNNFIGIGTAAPTAQLQVTGTVVSSNIYTNSNTTSNAPAYSFTGDTNTGMFNNTNGVIGFSCKGSNVMNLTNSNVVIGNSFAAAWPVSMRKLECQGGIVVPAGSLLSWYYNWGMYGNNGGTFNFCYGDPTALQLVSYINHNNGNYVAVSDARLKTDIQPLDYGLSNVLALNPVKYKLKTSTASSNLSLGLIAQEVLPNIPEVVSMSEEYYGVAYSSLVPVLINAIKEQQAQIDDLKIAISNLQP